jgi:SAM-dependent methyltransferase
MFQNIVGVAQKTGIPEDVINTYVSRGWLATVSKQGISNWWPSAELRNSSQHFLRPPVGRRRWPSLITHRRKLGMNALQVVQSSASSTDFYDLIAPIYDHHWGCQFFPEALLQFRRYISPRVPPNARILDLCCGSGRFAAYLDKANYRVTGVDSSRKLLAQAAERAPGACLVCADMSEFQLPELCDVAVCFYNALNHARDDKELRRIFGSVASHLVCGGYFLFDIISERELSYWSGEEYVLSEDMLYELNYSYVTSTRTATCRVRVRSRKEPGYIEAEALSEQRPIPASVIRAALRSAGFCVVFVRQFSHTSAPDGRLIVLAKRL